jgi:hypothetical protein
VDDERGYGCGRRALLYTLVITVAMFLCIGGTAAAIDVMCYNTLTQRLPVYPDAEVTLLRYNFVRAFGMGDTAMVLETTDPPEVVREWYGRTFGAAAQAARDNHDPFFNLATSAYSITAADSGSGSQIVLSGVCGS